MKRAMKITLDYKLNPDKDYTLKDINLYLYAYCEERNPEVARKLFDPLMTLVGYSMDLVMNYDVNKILVELPKFGREIQELREERQRRLSHEDNKENNL